MSGVPECFLDKVNSKDKNQSSNKHYSCSENALLKLSRSRDGDLTDVAYRRSPNNEKEESRKCKHKSRHTRRPTNPIEPIDKSVHVLQKGYDNGVRTKEC